ncbi:uncharacterized protein LOC110730453 [Chenopodium quinoa]|uniref:uncharacterized protein LOC110730453 n=1 Tax=Chenopodium quinoa TaxID=63459 RepID=UPI000B797346|nr:uncharacterized protein LOC110730453 [Chenopodium quinoa]
MAQPSRKLSDYSQPSLADFSHLAPAPNHEGVKFEIKPQFITMIERKQFSGAKERTTLLRSKILNFSQEADESLYEAWERFKDLQREYPHHGLAQWQIIQAFYNGIGYNSRMILDSAANGRFMNLDVNIASNVVEEMKLDNINNSNSSSVANVSAIGTNSAINCENCGLAYKQTSPYSNTYNAGLRNNQNMSYNSMNAPNPPPQVQQSQQRYYQPPHQRPQQPVTAPSDSGLSEIRTMLVDMQKQMQSRDAQIDSILAHNKIMDNQIAQLSSALQTRQQGALPSQPVQPTDHVNAITLRSGSKYDGPSMPKDDEPIITNIVNLDFVIPNIVVTSPALQGITPKKDKNQDKSGDVHKPVIKLPFPNRHLKSKLDKQFGKFLEVVKNLQCKCYSISCEL